MSSDCNLIVCHVLREVHNLVLLAGFVATETIARALKHIVAQPRPDTCRNLGICHSHGMPSSHTACIVFALAMQAMLSFRHRQRWAKGFTSSFGYFWKLLELAGTAAGACLVAYSRQYLGYHSWEQVGAGACLGACMALVWYPLMHAASPLYGRVAGLPLFSHLHFKDTWHVVEPLEGERKLARQQQQQQQSKKQQ